MKRSEFLKTIAAAAVVSTVAPSLIATAVSDFSNKRTTSIMLALQDQVSMLSVGQNKASFRMPYEAKLTSVRVLVKTPPTGSKAIISINRPEKRFSPDQNHYLELAFDKKETTFSCNTTLYDDDLINFNVGQVGSKFPGTGLNVELTLERS